ncbi:ADP-dependent glucokinase [Plakobranchus ocellatus]|uniref:ADP-dependent glucokinase n=1 Tax=Plakobranchus ocellatus TaxID=259542 RepID=A0AAV4A804_9GAST|nr:ADP-dependent glucokinase [Plakobranchus ocellatus]
MFQLSIKSVAVAVCFAVVSILFYTIQDSEDDAEKVTNIIKYWNSSISSPEKTFKKLVVGINSNLDVIVPGVALLKALNVSPGKKANHESLTNLKQLQETFAQFLARGSAAERPFLNKALYMEIIKAAKSLNQIEYFVGGNAALIAKKASHLFPDLQVHFVGAVGPMLETLMPKAIEIDPACHILQDEVHLIMEYKVGEAWGNSIAPVANRFVTSFDETNSQMLMMEPFFEVVKSSEYDLMVLSGLHMMDAQPVKMFEQRLDQLIVLLQDVPKSTVSHLELASMANEGFVKQIVEKVLPNVNSLGLNEQELVFASKSCGGPHHNLFDVEHHGQPDIHKISDILLWLMQTYGHSQKNNPSSRLTRIHFHSLTFHIIAVQETSWSNSDNAVAAGAQVAGLQACDTGALTNDLVDLKIPSNFKLFSGDSEREFDPDKPLMTWRKNGILFALSPVLVCKHPVKTVGLGDAISATGLMFSQHHSQ